jgi:MFS family permease
MTSSRSTTAALATLYASTILSGSWAMILPTIPVLSSAFQISTGTAAQVITALSLGRFAGMPISGIVLDRFGARASLVTGPAIACAAALLASIMPRFSLMLAPIFLIGVADSIWVIAREVAGVDLVPPRQRGRVLSGFHGVNYIGLSAGPLVGGILTQSLGFRSVFFGYAACAAVAVFLGITCETAPHDPQPRIKTPESTNGWTLRGIGRSLGGLRDLVLQIDPLWRPTYVVLVFATFTSFVHRVTTQSLIPVFASAELGMAPKDIGLLFTISGLSVFIMILPAGFVIDKVGRKWATVPSTGIPALAFLLIPFCGSFLQLAVLLSFLGVSNGLSLGSVATSTYDVVPASARGRLQALRRTVAEIGGVGAPLLGGILADHFNPGMPFLVYAPLLVLAALLLAFVARETLPR